MNQAKQQQQLNQFRKHLSINTYMAIPFLGINFYDNIFFVIYMLITGGLLIYKVEKYPMPQYSITIEAIILVLLILTHRMRAQIGTSCIIEKQPRKVVYYLIISVFMLCIYVFQLRLQLYVLLADFIINWIALAIIILECISAGWCFKVFYRKKNVV